jgi:hypothetical protein
MAYFTAGVAEVKKAWSYTSTTFYALIAWCFITDRGFTFTTLRNPNNLTVI